jgi:predicted ester cyclase
LPTSLHLVKTTFVDPATPNIFTPPRSGKDEGEFIDHGTLPGSESGEQFFTMTSSAFPDLQVIMEDEIAEGDKLVQRAATNGTMEGEFQGIPPTEKQVTMTVKT